LAPVRPSSAARLFSNVLAARPPFSITAAPASASAVAMPSPMPLDDPVTRATRPVKGLLEEFVMVVARKKEGVAVRPVLPPHLAGPPRRCQRSVKGATVL